MLFNQINYNSFTHMHKQQYLCGMPLRYYGSIYFGYGQGKSRIANWLSVSILKSNQQENCWVRKFAACVCVWGGEKSCEKFYFLEKSADFTPSFSSSYYTHIIIIMLYS